MSSYSYSSIILCFLFFSSALSLPTPLLTPITKDPSTLHYTTPINYHQTPLKPTNLLIDLDSSINWLNCTSPSSSLPIPCNSSLCTSLNSIACSNTTCALFPENPLTRKSTIAEAVHDSVSFPITNGRNPGQLTPIPDFIFSCSSQPELLNSLPESVSGVISFSRSNFSLPAQISNTLTVPFLFALCLSGSPSAPGVAFFGTRGPYIFHPETDLANSLIYTPLLLNPISNAVVSSTGRRPSDEYYINVTSVKVNGKAVKINDSLLVIDENGFGGTKFSAVVPYTTMETSIYKEFAKAFVKEAGSMNLVVSNSSVGPFDVCFSSDDVEWTRLGPAVPTVDLVMENDDVYWRIFGGNSMVKFNEKEGEDVWCLGFVDGGPGPSSGGSRASIVIGGHQMDDHLIQFDLGLKRVGFSSTLLIEKTSCGNFNFTSNGNL